MTTPNDPAPEVPVHVVASDLEPLIAAMVAFQDTGEKLADSLVLMKRDIRDAQHLRRLLLVAIVLDLCVTVATAIIITITVHSNSAVAAIQDCTQPSGKCYQNNQVQLGKTIGAINDANVRGTEAIRVCATEGQDTSISVLDTCVKGLLGQSHP